MQIQPYLSFEGRCEEALDFYKKALGAKVEMMMRFKDAPDPSMISPGSEDKIMHCAFHVGDAVLMASDGRCAGTTNFHGITLSLQPTTVAEADKMFAALAEGGQIQMPQSETFFSPRFGMVTDKFGVPWMVVVMQ